jgi:hypothetical protein
MFKHTQNFNNQKNALILFLMKRGWRQICLVFLCCYTLLQIACTYNHLPESNKKIILNWYPAPALQTKEEFTTGLVWLFSYLGAKLPAENFKEGVKFIESKKIELNIDELGFSAQAIVNIEQLINLIKQTQEYKTQGGIDAGRFFALCFNSTYHYYKITGAPKTYSDFSAKFAGLAYKTFVCDTSSISNFSRIFNYTIDDLNIQKNYFVSEEGNGRYSNGTFVKSGIIEAFDYMDNGQPRFVIYNQQGDLYAPKDPASHPAGKPAKCMWCHESGMQPLFTSTSNIPGFVGTADFLEDQRIFTSKLKAFHAQTNAQINFSDNKAHTQGEFIYLCFNEPNASRLADEWNISEDAVKKMLSGIPTHVNYEFPFLKDVYYRAQIEKYAPYKSIAVSDEMREATNNEPNYLK